MSELSKFNININTSVACTVSAGHVRSARRWSQRPAAWTVVAWLIADHSYWRRVPAHSLALCCPLPWDSACK